MKLILIILIGFLVSGCTYNVEEVKRIAPEFLRQNGFEIITYEGYTSSVVTTCGGNVWYIVKRKDSDVLYNLFLCKWHDELHIYDIKALNALSNKNP